MAGVLFLLPGTTVDDVAAAVVRHLVPAVPVAGSVGEKLARVDATVSSRATPADVNVQVYSEPVPEGKVH